jgi:2-dehydropantoate 2-reductase
MRLAVLGTGAVGGYIAARLFDSGADISVVARGATLKAIQSHGLVMEEGSERVVAKLRATDNATDIGPVDAVIVTVKATNSKALAASLAPLVSPETLVVFAQNGIPWWYGIGLAASRPRPPDLSAFDVDGKLAALVKPDQIIGGVIHSSNAMEEPGIVVNESVGSNTLHIGAADDSSSARIGELRAILTNARINSPPNSDIRQAIWRKLTINMTASILCLVTGQRATMIRDDERIAELYGKLTVEAQSIAAAHGITLSPADPEKFRLNAPDHLPSIRQDYDRGRTLEIDALVAAPLAFARSAGVAVPHVETLAAIAMRMARDRGTETTLPIPQ